MATARAADLVTAVAERNVDVVIAFGNRTDRVSDAVDRAAQLILGDNEAEDGTGADANHDDGTDDEEDPLLEGLQRGLDIGQALLVDIDDGVDFLLEGLAVVAVGVVIALFVGSSDAHRRAEPCGLGAELLEFLGTVHDLGEIVLLGSRHQRRPGGDHSVHLGEVIHQAVGKFLRLFRRGSTIDAARFHDDGGDEAVEPFAVIGALGSKLVFFELAAIADHGKQGRRADHQ